jgi:hypothetical protein
MPGGSSGQPQRTKRSTSRRSTRAGRNRSSSAPPRNSRGAWVRERLKRDPFLFLLCLGVLAFSTWAFALTWWVTGGAVPLALALVSIAPAFFLFYLRDA